MIIYFRQGGICGFTMINKINVCHGYLTIMLFPLQRKVSQVILAEAKYARLRWWHHLGALSKPHQSVQAGAARLGH